MTPTEARNIWARIEAFQRDFDFKNRKVKAIDMVSTILDDPNGFEGFFSGLGLKGKADKMDAYYKTWRLFEEATSVDHGEHDRFMNVLRDFSRHDVEVEQIPAHEFYHVLANGYTPSSPQTLTSGSPPTLWDEEGNLIRNASIYSKFQKINIQHQASRFFHKSPSSWVKACSTLTTMQVNDRKVVSELLNGVLAYYHVTALDERRQALRPFVDAKTDLKKVMDSMDLRNTMLLESSENLKARIENFIAVARLEDEIDLAADLIKDNIQTIYDRNPSAREHRTSTDVYVTLLDAYASLGFNLEELKDTIFRNDVTPDRTALEVMIDHLNPSLDGADDADSRSVIAGAFFERLGKDELLKTEVDQDRLLKAYTYTKLNPLRERLMGTDKVVDLLEIDLGL